MGWWRRWRWPLLVAAATGFVVWNLVFDLWLGQGERQYLWESAKHALGEGPPVSLQGSMSSSIRAGLIVATAWMAVVVVAILGTAWLGYRAGRVGRQDAAVSEAHAEKARPLDRS